MDLDLPATPVFSLPPSVAAASSHTEARIVIVDDEPLNSAELGAFLASLGLAQVVTLAPNADALDALRDERPDLILLTLAPPADEALAVLGQLSADRQLRHVPVLAITAQDEQPMRLQALELGVTDYLVKPIDPVELALRLRNVLATKARLDRLAYTDSLTGLPNRESANSRLEWALKFAHRHGRAGAVLHVGLDGFERIDDAVGPALADELLRAVGQRLGACLRATDFMAGDPAPESTSASTSASTPRVMRGDGKEFAVLLPVMTKSDDAAVVAARIVAAMSEPFTLAGQPTLVGCRIGIAVFESDAPDADTVSRQARIAMHHARPEGDCTGSAFRFFEPELDGRSSARLALERGLHLALERGELLLHYQPKVDVASGRVCGAEALVRWQHPERGLLGPGAFIEVAEDSGLIVPLGDWVLREALRQVARWRDAGLPMLAVAVNVSSLQLRRPHLEHEVREALAEAGLAGPSLCLELTESAMIDSGGAVHSALSAIKDLGVRLALDDFGTGFSSLSYLRRFPIDELKIDRSFIAECHAGNNSATLITQAIIAMAHGMRLAVVAEGVETAEQLEFLRHNGCDQYQGFLFSRPVPAAEFEARFLRGGSFLPQPGAPAAVAGSAPDFKQYADTGFGDIFPE